jgi:hypothetical protein
MYWDIFVAAAASIVIGFLWYGPIFGKSWMKLMNISEKQMQDAKKKGMPASTWIWMLISTLVMIGVLKVVLIRFGTTTYVEAIKDGAMLWLGLVAPVQLGQVMWENRPWGLFLLNTAYYVVNLVVAAVLLITF